jgi:hypothetical protein
VTFSLSLEWNHQASDARVYAIGNVQPVIYSRVDQVTRLPEVSYGLGALTVQGSAEVGEGIIVRGKTAITPPVIDAGVRLIYRHSLDTVSTPFCLGWTGEPVARGTFQGRPQIGVREIFQEIFRQAAGHTQIVLVELIALARPKDIHDRALQKPVHTGNVLITSPEYAVDYFRSNIIRQELSHQENETIPLVVIGTGFLPGEKGKGAKEFEQAVFYQPPQLNLSQPITPLSPLKTHSHAMGWRNQGHLHWLLAHLPENSQLAANYEAIDQEISVLVESPPDYMVHLDEWSELITGTIQVFTASPEQLHFIPVNTP